VIQRKMVRMSDDTLRTVEIERLSLGRYRATNVRGGTVTIGGRDDTEFTPVELLLAALGGCGAADVDYITVKRAEPESFRVTVTGDKIRDDDGNRLTNLAVTFRITFPADADAAREALPRAVAQSHDRLCTVSRTVQLGTPVEDRIASSDGS
jgi:putative redox protein